MKKNSGRKKLFVGRAVFLAFAAALLIKTFFFDIMIAEGYSMSPAIKPGSLLLVCKIYYGIRQPGSGNYLVRWGGPCSGDVVVFYTPLGEIAVKRLSALLPEGLFIALGDNDTQSYDSRYYGPVPNDNIIGRVLGIKR